MKQKYLFQLLMLSAGLVSGCSGGDQTSPQRKNIADAVFASGNIVMDGQYYVTSINEGYLVKSIVKEGDTVSIGEPLFYIQDETPQAQLKETEVAYRHALENISPVSPVLQKLEQQKNQQKNQLETDSVNFIRFKNLIASNAVSRADLDKARLSFENSKAALLAQENTIEDMKKNLQTDLANAKANLVAQQNNSSYYTLTSKVDSGIVLQTMKEDGELVKKGETVAEIGAGVYLAKLEIAEEDIGLVKIGQPVYIELNTDKKKSYLAYISRIYPQFDNEKQSFIAEARFSEKVPALKPGAQLQADIVVQKKQHALVIPSSYLLPNDYILIKGKTGKVKVETGISTSEWTEILQGVKENDVLMMP